jgi:hypothetical protein
MSGAFRIALSALLLGGAGAAGFVGWSKSAQRLPAAQSENAITRAAQAAADGLQGELVGLRARAKMAAAIQPLRAALADSVDVHTLIDLFATEDWWRGPREDMAATRVYIGDAVAHHGLVDLGDRDQPVVAAARKDGLASAIVAVSGRPMMIAGARIDAPAALKGEPVLVLGRPFEQRTLAQVAVRTELGLLLTDGRVPLALAGNDEHRAFLEALTTRKDAAVIDAEAGREAARIPLSRSVALWATRPAVVAVAPANQQVMFFGGSGLMVVLGLGLLLFGRRASPHNEFPAESTLPFGTGQRPRARPPRSSGARRAPGAPTPTPVTAHATPARPHWEHPGTSSDALPAAVIPMGGGSRGDPPPKLFGRYKILERLGMGGMSEVYTAVAHGAEGFSRTFVIKRLRHELARNKEAVSQFIDEARVQAGMVHSNIVPVFDFGVMGDEYFMIEEYVVGRDLARVSARCVERTGMRLEPKLVFYFAHEALQALGYAHAKRGRDGEPLGIVHRDVSATNIMLAASGEVKLFDFGIAKANSRQTQTQSGMVKGNANFMSPEQARGQAVDGRSDLYALALVMYFCFTNTLLYTGDNDLDILYRAACGPTAEDLALVRQLPPPAGEILSKALAVDPADRYQTAEEFAAALSPHAGGMKNEAASLMELLFGDELRREAA